MQDSRCKPVLCCFVLDADETSALMQRTQRSGPRAATTFTCSACWLGRTVAQPARCVAQTSPLKSCCSSGDGPGCHNTVLMPLGFRGSSQFEHASQCQQLSLLAMSMCLCHCCTFAAAFFSSGMFCRCRAVCKAAVLVAGHSIMPWQGCAKIISDSAPCTPAMTMQGTCS